MSKNYCPYCMTQVPEGESCSVCGLTSGTYIPSPHHLPPGTVLMNRYLVGRVLGEGGFGITYIGCDLRLELKVAIKEYYPVDRATRNASASLEVTNFMGPSAKSYERGRQKFLGEAQVMARMDKQQVIVSVRDFFEINNTAYIVMEYIEGITFRELVEKKGGKIPAEELFPMIEPLFHALSIMHENGLIHRDISPDNLMLENGRIRLLDFGCAREASRGTETMTIALKHGYAPIEQYQQKGQGPWTDIYALSATIYYCLTGKIPPQALDRITEDELLLPSKLGIPLSAAREKALLKGMKLQPGRRFASAEEMWRAIYAQTDEEAGADDDSEEREEAGEHKEHEIRGKADVPEESEERRKSGVRDEKSEEREASDARNEESEERRGFDTQDKENEERKESGMQDEKNKEREASDEWDEKSEEDSEAAKKPAPDKKVKFYVGAGIAAACMIVALTVWSSHSSKNDALKTSGSNEKAETAERDDPGTGTDTDVKSADTDLPALDSHTFDQAVTFTGGVDEDFQKLMEDDLVEAVIVDCEYMPVSRTTITKPVLLSKNTFWPVDSLAITEEGFLQVEGNLDMSSSGYLRLHGNTLRLYVADGGMFQSNHAFVWMDDEACLAIMGDNGAVESPMEHRLIFDEDVFATQEVCSVTDFASLKRVMETGAPVSIDADITLEDEVHFSGPVRIAQGVTVRTIQEKGNCHNFVVETGAILVNEGTLEGNLGVFDGGTVINHNMLGMKVIEGEPCASLWVQDKSTVVNFGTIGANNTSRFWENALFVNLGDLHCYDFYLSGGYMANLGKVEVAGKESRFEIINGSRLFNKAGGAIDVKEEGFMWNDAWICNTGEIVVGNNGHFENALLENNGSFRVMSGGGVDTDRPGIYYGAGEYDIGGADLKTYHTTGYQLREIEGLAEVAKEEELLTALNAADTKAVLVREDITVHTDLTIRKPLFIDQGCSLTMTDGAAVLDYGNVITLIEGASLCGKDITLQEDAQIYMEGNTHLVVEQGGSLTLDSSLLWGQGAGVELKEASFLLENEAGFAFQDMGYLRISDSEMTLQNKSVFVVPPDCREMDMERNSVTLSVTGAHSYLYTAGDTLLKDSSLRIDAGGLRNRGKALSLQNCMISIGQEGELNSDCSNLSLLSGTTLSNEGLISVFGWDEYQLTVHGRMDNYGTMDLSITHMDLSEPINNQNKVYYHSNHYRQSDSGDWDDSYVSGNAAIDYDAQ